MYFDTRISVIITDQFSGEQKALQTVIEIKAENDGKNIGSNCDIMVPLNCRIEYVAAPTTFLTGYPQTLFRVGDGILIQAAYIGHPWVTIFDGFVWDFVEGNPTKIRCLDYLFYLQQGTINISHKTIQIQELVTNILPAPIKLILPTINFQLYDISFITMSPAAILLYLKKNLGLNITLMGTQLYMNVASNTTTTIDYSTDRNIIESNLQHPDAIYKTFKVTAHFANENGTVSTLQIGDPNGVLKECFFYNVKDTSLYKGLAENFLFQCKQEKYSGNVETYLYPECQLFQKANYTDLRYPDRSGVYVITAITITLDEHGFHRHLKFSYLDTVTAL